MRTGEVEKLTEVKEANIKFYEREGLIKPRRNENGYRDFSDEDVKIINRIKTLRMLDVPIPEIKKLFDGDVQLEAVLEERLSEMNLQAKVLDNRMESCRRIIKEGMELADISPEVLSGNREEWSEKLRHIVDEDIDKRFILKGVAFTAAFAVGVKFTVVVLTKGGFSQQDTVFCFFGGMLAILCGFVYIFAEACYEVTVVKRRLQESFFSRHGTFVFS
ncbi:MerR family transcriptional regulator [Anaerovoracaceae bacterium HCP3S3_H6]